MDMQISAVMIAAIFTLAGCAAPADDPANVPQLGNWKKSSTLESVEVGSEYAAGEAIPLDVANSLGGRLNFETLGCSEPLVRDEKQMEELLPPKLKDACTVRVRPEPDGRSRLDGVCEGGKLPHGVRSMTFSGDGRISADRIDVRFYVNVVAAGNDGVETRTRIVQHQLYERIGTCS